MTNQLKDQLAKTANHHPNRRKAPAKPRKKDERRVDMRIVTSVSQADLYLWAISIAIMCSIGVFFLVASFLFIK